MKDKSLGKERRDLNTLKKKSEGKLRKKWKVENISYNRNVRGMRRKRNRKTGQRRKR